MRTARRPRAIVGSALLALVAAGPAAAQDSPLEELLPEKLLAGTPFAVDEMVATAVAEVEGSPLVLREALATALDRSPEIREGVLGPVLSESELEARRGVYALTFFASGAAARTLTPSASALSGAASVDERVQRFGGGLTQPIAPTGGEVSLELDHEIRETNSSFTSLSPQHTPTLALRLHQPLLRDLLVDRSRADIRLAEVDVGRSEATLAALTRSVAANAESGFWDLYAAMQTARIRRLSLELGRKLLANDRRRYELGVLPFPEVVDVEATVARLSTTSWSPGASSGRRATGSGGPSASPSASRTCSPRTCRPTPGPCSPSRSSWPGPSSAATTSPERGWT